MNKKIYFTTSFDDGSIYDLKLVELLSKYNIKGTFYIPIKNTERGESLGSKQIRQISELFEIGGHTYSHTVLTNVDEVTAKKEIEEGKKALENITEREIVAFCPPKGKFDKKKYLPLIQDAGFKLVRTTGYIRTKNIIENYNNIWLIHTTLQFYPHKPVSYIVSAVKRKDKEGLLYISKNLLNLKWDRLLQAISREVILSGGVFHLWGHSWEIEEYNLWNKLEDFFKYVKSCENIQFLTNYEVYTKYACG